MKKEEIVKKNISLVFDFLRYLTDHPEFIEKIPDNCELEFLDKDFPYPIQIYWKYSQKMNAGIHQWCLHLAYYIKNQINLMLRR